MECDGPKQILHLLLTVMWTSRESHSVISMWQSHSFHLVSSRSVARFRRIGWMLFAYLWWKRGKKKLQNQKLVNKSVQMGVFQDASIPEDGTCCSKHGSKEKLSLRWTGNPGSSLWKEQIIQNFLLWIPSWIYLDSLDCKLQVKNKQKLHLLYLLLFFFLYFFFLFLVVVFSFPLSVAKFLYDLGHCGWGKKWNFWKPLMTGELLNENCC